MAAQTAGGPPDGSGDPAPASPPAGSRAGRNLPMAIGVGVGLGAIALLSLLTYRVTFLVVIAAAIAVSVWELQGTLRRARGLTLSWIPVTLGAVATMALAWPYGAAALGIGVAATTLLCMVWRLPGGADGYLADLSASVFVTVYIGLFAGFATLMLVPDDGAQRILTFLILVVANDVGGYTAGVLAGKHPMAPTISPKKSWEGFGGSVAGCMLAGALCVWLLLDGVWWHGLIIGVAIAATATIGDLTESLIKRDLGVKDMGTILPGHGGLMDRMDSLLPSAVVTWALLTVLV
ncbi:phosphatidate cytidylyltransferase [Nakamurella sp.]|uniref:phosphatidate cytidylyltransferase n=1 Tax=Nakamurella sp. TaxID=1869182 RepID=UPI003B3B31F9